jgi:hypothetical protein
VHDTSGDIKEGENMVAVVSSCTCLAMTWVPCICPYGLLLLYLPCVELVGLIVYDRPYGELLGSSTALCNLTGLQRLLAEKHELAEFFLP